LSKIIGATPGTTPNEPAPFSMTSVEARIDDLIARARERANEIISEAQARAARIREAARAEGYQQGRREGRDDGLEDGRREGAQIAQQAFQTETAGTVQALEKLLAYLEEHRLALLRQAELNLVRLAIALAEKVVKVQVAHDSDSVARANLEETLDYVMSHEAVTVRANPANIEAVKAHLSTLAAAAEGVSSAQLVPDETVEPGGVVVTTNGGGIDARLSTQLERLAEQILGLESDAE